MSDEVKQRLTAKDMPVTLESVDEMVKGWRMGPEKKTIVPRSIQGIPEGFAYFIETMSPIDDLVQHGYLIAFREGFLLGDPQNRAMCYKPVVVKKDATQTEIDSEFAQQEKQLVECYINER